MKIGSLTVVSKETYEKLYIKTKKNAKFIIWQ